MYQTSAMDRVEMGLVIQGMLLRELLDSSDIPDLFPVEQEEIMRYLHSVHSIGNFEATHPWSSMRVDLEDRVGKYLQLRGIDLHYLNKDITKLLTCEAASRNMGGTSYVPHFILAGLFLYRSGAFGRREEVERLAAEYSHIDDSSTEGEQDTEFDIDYESDFDIDDE